MEYKLKLFKKGKIETLIVRADKVYIMNHLISFSKFIQYEGEKELTSDVFFAVRSANVDELIELGSEEYVERLEEE